MNINKFTDLKEKQITVCQKLIPMGKTRENIDIFNSMQNDAYVVNNKSEITKLIKLMAKDKMEQSIKKIKDDINFDNLFTLMKEYNAEENIENKTSLTEKIFDEKVSLAKNITQEFKIKYVGADTITKLVPEYVKENYEEPKKSDYLKLLEEVKKKQAMFNRYEASIDDVFSPIIKKGTIVYRILNENAQLFLQNELRIENINYSGILENSNIDEDVKSILFSKCINLEFNAYKNLLLQEDIDRYNYCIGIINAESKIYCDKNKYNYKDYELKKLYKALLCEKTSLFEKIESFENDKQVIDAYNSFVTNVNKAQLYKLYENCTNNTDLYIKETYIATYSNLVYGKWNIARDCIKAYCKDEMTVKRKKSGLNTYYDNFVKNGLTINKLDDIISEYACELNIKYHKNDIFNIIYESLMHKYKNIEADNLSLKSDKSINAGVIRNELYHCNNTLRLLRIYDTDNEKFNNDAGLIIEQIINKLSPANELYNMTRNYIVEKPTPKKKLSLTFNTSGFGGGWSESVESSKRVGLLQDNDGNKYFMVYNITGCQANNVALSHVTENIKSKLVDEKPDYDCYKKLVYSAVPDAIKDISRLFINKLEDKEIINRYKNKEHKENITFLNELIDIVKEKIKVHPTWSKYDFTFKKYYDSFDDFCKDINEQGYYAKWKYISKTIIDRYVDNGCIYLFRIYNNDYSKHKKAGSKIKTHTKYINYLFSEENEKTNLIKLLGGAEVFYREPQIANPYVHKQGSVLVNKRYKNGKIIGNEYKSLLEKAQTTTLDDVYTRVLPYDVIKDKRYTMEQFEIHFPIKIGLSNNLNDFNEISKDYIREASNTIVVGRNRQHLLYLSVYENETLIYSKSLNEVNGVNYKDKLFIIEEAKKNNAKNWKTIGSNDALLNGYISAAIKEITDMILKYQATLVIEIGNNQKSARTLLPNRVYAKFKEALLHKLEFLVDSTKADYECGGLLHPYHLVEINKKNKKRSIDAPWNGIVLQVPSFYCGQTDPDTNLCNLTYATSRKEKEEVLKKIKNFRYDKGENIFKFDYDMSKFNPNIKGKFICRSNGNRLIKLKDNDTILDLTHYIEDMLKSVGIEYESGNNINLVSDDKLTTETLFNCIRYTLQMNNGNFFISPVTGLSYTCNDCLNIAYNKNLYNRSKLIKEELKNGKKLKFISIKDIYKPQP